jgi:hypothetical protein
VGGAYRQNGFSGEPDEPSHYLSGLMIRDYAASGMHSPPLRFARDYYERHPSMGIGYWPPLFYLAEAAWLLVFGISRKSVLLLIAAVTAGIQFLIFRRARSEFGWVAAFTLAATFAAIAVVRRASSMVMTDLPVTLLSFGATLAAGRLLAQPKMKQGIAFGVWSGLAFLTKLAGAFVALVLPLAVLFTRRLRILGRPAFWVPAAVVALLYGPWFIWTFDLVQAGTLPAGFKPDFAVTVAEFCRTLVHCAGVGIAIAAAAGGILAIATRDPLWAVLAAHPISVAVFLAISPVEMDERYLIPALPAVLLLGAYGVRWTLLRLRAGRRTLAASLALAAPLLCLPGIAHPQGGETSNQDGLRQAAEFLVSAAPPDAAILVSGSDIVDVQLVAELASLERHRPGHRTVRANKLLAEIDWNGTRYNQRFFSAADTLAALRADGVKFVLLEDRKFDRKTAPHHLLLHAALDSAPAQWRKVKSAGDSYATWTVYAASPQP